MKLQTVYFIIIHAYICITQFTQYTVDKNCWRNAENM